MAVTLLVVGAGARARDYLDFVDEAGLKVVAVADPDKERRESAAKRFNIARANIFEDGMKALSTRIADAALIATPDKTHHGLALQALKTGYDLLLEKPIAVDPRHCLDIAEAQEREGSAVSVCHVLRYAPFFQQIKKIAMSGELGKIQDIDLMEQVGYWHFAHSYVRGNWAKEKESSPVILAKSSHDLDIISWLADSRPTKVFSTGSLRHFTEKNSPEGSPRRCTDGCRAECVFDARKIYINSKEGWPFAVVSIEATEEARRKALEAGPYGRCVYKCDNDVCDSQDVLIEFENGIKANFSLRPSGDFPTRRIHISFEQGELIGDLYRGEIRYVRYAGVVGGDITRNINLGGGSHGGGDPLLLKDFVKLVKSKDLSFNLSSIQKSLQGHLLAFAAERSRHSGETVDYKAYVDQMKGRQ